MMMMPILTDRRLESQREMRYIRNDDDEAHEKDPKPRGVASITPAVAMEQSNQQQQSVSFLRKKQPEEEPSCLTVDVSGFDPAVSFSPYQKNKPVIINLGLPKVGSTTLAQFFDCGGYQSNHWKIANNEHKEEEEGIHLGPCIQQAIAEKRASPLQYCEEQAGYTRRHFDAWMQLDYTIRGECIFPQISYLEELHEEYPDAIFLLPHRPPRDWYRSLQNWKRMDVRMQEQCPESFGLLLNQPSEATFLDFWCRHVERARRFVQQHPTHRLLEMDLYDTATTAQHLSRFFGIPSKCWGHGKDSHMLRIQDTDAAAAATAPTGRPGCRRPSADSRW